MDIIEEEFYILCSRESGVLLEEVNAAFYVFEELVYYKIISERKYNKLLNYYYTVKNMLSNPHDEEEYIIQYLKSDFYCYTVQDIQNLLTILVYPYNTWKFLTYEEVIDLLPTEKQHQELTGIITEKVLQPLFGKYDNNFVINWMERLDNIIYDIEELEEYEPFY